jgi:hypothetical protein
VEAAAHDHMSKITTTATQCVRPFRFSVLSSRNMFAAHIKLLCVHGLSMNVTLASSVELVQLSLSGRLVKKIGGGPSLLSIRRTLRFAKNKGILYPSINALYRWATIVTLQYKRLSNLKICREA